MTRSIWIWLGALPAFACASLAQNADQGKPAPGNPAGSPADTREVAPGVPALGQANVADRAFIRAATLGGRAEVQFGKLAETKASSEAVKNFGRQMARDHGAATDRLFSLAGRLSVALPPDQLDPEHKILRSRLDAEDGIKFNKDYIDAQIGDHQKTAQLFEYEIGSGQDAQLKAFASDQLPVIFEHLRMARVLSDALAIQMMAAASPPQK